MMTIKTKHDTGDAFLWIQDGIAYLVHKEGKKATLKSAIKETKIHQQLCSGSKLPLFADIREMISADIQSRDYGNSEVTINTYQAVAILVGNPITRIIGSFFLKIQKPPYPVKMFTKKVNAIRWLQQFRDN